MSKVLDKATAHFRTRISGEMRKIHVPEWECDLYFKEASSLKEESKILELSQQGKSVEAIVESLIIKARNQDGTRMFSQAEKPVLMNEVDPSVIIRVVGEMNQVNNDVGSQEEIEKN